METLAIYLLKSVSWLTGFAVVYFLFLKNERFFGVKRIYLISGIIISFIFPLISVHYQVDVPAPGIIPADFSGAGIQDVSVQQQAVPDKSFDFRIILLLLYIAGVLLLALRMVFHIRLLFKSINRGEINYNGPARLIRAPEFPSSFSFFNYIFINPSVNETETKEIMNHELVHIYQKHWFDLLLIETLRIIQWVNPFAWIYAGFIRQNHEYLADEVALKKTTNPAIYRAALVNQLFSAPVISLSNSFNNSLNKQRFEMMKKIITSPYRKMKIFFILPVFAIIFYAFATPEYNYTAADESTMTITEAPVIFIKDVKGIVIKEDGTPFPGVPILVTGTTIRSTTDASGSFTLSDVPEDAFIVFSYRGYLTQVLKADFKKGMTVKIFKDPDYREIPTVSYGSGTSTATGSGNKPAGEPVIVVDNVITAKTRQDVMGDLNNQIASVKNLPAKEATEKYGEKGKYGAFEIMTLKRAAELGIKVPFRRRNPEDYPTFLGNSSGYFSEWISGQIKYPPEATSRGAHGNVYAVYTVEADGSLSNVKYTGSPDPLIGSAVVNAILSSPKWEPAKNPEATEPYTGNVTVRFELPDKVMKQEAPFVVVEEMPVYPGGDIELLKFVAQNTQYPDSAKAKGIEGRVIIRFAITTDGETEDVTVLKGVHPLLDNEAIRVVDMLKGFRPGTQGGRAVPVWYMIPVTFTLAPKVNK